MTFAPACPSHVPQVGYFESLLQDLDQVDLTVEEALGKTMKDFYAQRF